MTCLCTGACFNGGCSSYPRGRSQDITRLRDEYISNPIEKRLSELESKLSIHEASLNRKWNANSELNLRMTCIEKTIEGMQKQINETVEMIVVKCRKLEDEQKGFIKKWFEEKCQIENNISSLNELTKRITEDDMKCGRKPYKCPVCDGDGRVLHPMNGLALRMCVSCEGKGIVWG